MEHMRLYNIYYTCKAALAGMRRLRYENSSAGGTMLSGWKDSKAALEALFPVKFISDEAVSAYSAISPLDRDQEVPVIGDKTLGKFRPLFETVLHKVEAVVELYESMRDGTSRPGVDIKLPPCTDLKEYISYLKDVEFILYQCPYLQSDDEELKFGGTDVGSDWITFVLSATAISTCAFCILNNLAVLVSKAVELKSNLTVIKMQEETLEILKNKREVGDETIETFRKLKKLTYKKYVDEAIDEMGGLNDGEEVDKVELALDKLANLLDKGAEIYTSIETPKEIKVLFPFADTQTALPEGLQKYLEDKAAGEDKRDK